jgi:hypothetical protein
MTVQVASRPTAQAEVCAAALTLRLGASICHSPRELPVAPRAVGDDFSKLEGLAAFSVVVMGGSSDQVGVQ